MKKELIAVVIKHYGSQRAMARSLCVTEGAVSQWVKAGFFPAAQAIRIEAATNGRIKAVDLWDLSK